MNQLILESIRVERNNKLICKDLSLVFNEEIYTLLGPNGSGKTSLLYALAQWLPLQAGNIKLNENNVVNLDTKARALLIGILPQNALINLSCSVFDFVLTGRFPYQSYFASPSDQDYAKVKEMLALLELSNLAKRCINTLSGGELQRAKIACILTQDPTVFLLDEPCNHLDIKYQLILLEYLKYLTKNKKKIIILSSHHYHLTKAFSEKNLLLFESGPTLYDAIITKKVLADLYQLPENCSLL